VLGIFIESLERVMLAKNGFEVNYFGCHYNCKMIYKLQRSVKELQCSVVTNAPPHFLAFPWTSELDGACSSESQ